MIPNMIPNIINDERVIAIYATDEVNSDGDIETFYLVVTQTKEYWYTSIGECLNSWDRIIERRIERSKKGGKIKACESFIKVVDK